MTVTSTTAISGPYDGNDATVTFDYTFVITTESELKVTLTDEDGVDTVQTLTTHYSVTIGDDGTGTFTMVTAPATGEQVTATMQVEGTQETDLLNYGAFNAEVIEDALDKLTRLYLQLSERVDRCLKLGQSDESDPEDVTLANFTQQAYLDTSNFDVVLSSADTSIQAAMETLDDSGYGKVLIDEAYTAAGSYLDASGDLSSYDMIQIELVFLALVSGSYATYQFLDSGGSALTGAYYNSLGDGLDSNDAAVTWGQNLQTSGKLTESQGTLAANAAHGILYLSNASTYVKRLTGNIAWVQVTTGYVVGCNVACSYTDIPETFTGMRFAANSGNISARIRLWGMPKG